MRVNRIIWDLVYYAGLAACVSGLAAVALFDLPPRGPTTTERVVVKRAIPESYTVAGISKDGISPAKAVLRNYLRDELAGTYGGSYSFFPSPAAAPYGGIPLGSNEVHVEGYQRSDGTIVAPHYRTAPNGTRADNWSTLGNVNPHTGATGTIPLR